MTSAREVDVSDAPATTTTTQERPSRDSSPPATGCRNGSPRPGATPPLQGFPPIATEPLGNTTNLVALGGVLWHWNSDLVVMCVFIATKILSCNIFLCCNRLTLMHTFWWFVLHLVGNTASPFLRYISMSLVAIESCYGHGTRLGCAWTAISQRLIWVANISCDVATGWR
jgi:hypothetical protein